MPISSKRERQLAGMLESHMIATLNAMPTEAELAARNTFSPEFEARMARLLEQARRSLSPAGPMPDGAGRKATARAKGPAIDFTRPAATDHDRVSRFPRRGRRLLFIAILTAILVSVFSISAAREPVLRFFIRTYQTFSQIVFSQSDNGAATPSPGAAVPSPGAGLPGIGASLPDAGLLPTWLPEGYRQAETTTATGYLQIIYTGKSGDDLFFERQNAGMVGITIDSEEIVKETVTIGSNEGLWFSVKGVQNLIWRDGIYAYCISGKIDKDAILKMANSTK